MEGGKVVSSFGPRISTALGILHVIRSLELAEKKNEETGRKLNTGRHGNFTWKCFRPRCAKIKRSPHDILVCSQVVYVIISYFVNDIHEIFVVWFKIIDSGRFGSDKL